MAQQHVHRIARGDGGNPILVNVRAGSGSELELDIEGTEGENPYYFHFNHTQLLSAQAKNTDLSASDWELILRSTLLHERTPTPSLPTKSPLNNLERTANLSATSLTLAFRHSISGIHRRLGELPLPLNEAKEFDTLSWVGTATDRADALEAEVRELKQKLEAREKDVGELAGRFEGLVAAKKEHEEELVGKFVGLLNAKKRKVRELMVVLSGSKVDEEKVEALANSRGMGSKSRQPNTRSSTRRRKRKQDAQEAALSDSDEFESMQGIQKGAVKASGLRNDNGESDEISEQSDLDVTTEDEGSGVDDLPERKLPSRSNQGGSEDDGGGDGNQPDQPQDDDEPLPPRRDLPFVAKDREKKAGEEKNLDSQVMDVDEDVETTDDEL